MENPKENSPILVLTEDSAIEYLRARGLIDAETQCTTESAGDGNINWVRRIRASDGRSWVIKQAREQLEKFPQYRADTRRILVEAAWLQQAASVDHDACCPEIIDFDPDRRVLVLEDLGLCPRLDEELLTERNLAVPLETIGGLLGRLHRKTSDDASLAATFRSTNMRELHFAHIFELPFSENDFPLPEPVRERARGLYKDEALQKEIQALHQKCCTKQEVLVHADPQPGNILLPDERVKLLDAEIAHLGCAALDPGIVLAHLALGAIALQNDSLLARRAQPFWESYQADAGEVADWETTVRVAGVEMLRRTIGAARVAAVGEVAASLTAIETGCAWLLHPAPGIARLDIR